MTPAHTPKVKDTEEQASGAASLNALVRKLQKIVLAYTFLARDVSAENVYKKELDTACVLFHKHVSCIGHIEKKDVHILRKTLVLAEQCLQSLVVSSHVKGHLFTFVRDAARSVLKDIYTQLDAEAQHPSLYLPLTHIMHEADRDESYADTVVAGETEGTVAQLPRRPRPSIHAARKSLPKAPATSRTEDIYLFIQKSGTVGLPAVAAAFPNVSSKTVQRTLVALIEAGKISKTGDRRWTQYSRA